MNWPFPRSRGRVPGPDHGRLDHAHDLLRAHGHDLAHVLDLDRRADRVPAAPSPGGVGKWRSGIAGAVPTLAPARGRANGGEKDGER
jgi:hypothetical protein